MKLTEVVRKKYGGFEDLPPKDRLGSPDVHGNDGREMYDERPGKRHRWVIFDDKRGDVIGDFSYDTRERAEETLRAEFTPEERRKYEVIQIKDMFP